jgi:uncharacterized protein YgiM (DUF1202 family)
MTNINFKIVFVLSFIVVLLLAHSTKAEDCMQDPVYDVNWNAEVTTGVRLRDIPCMETSKVLATAPVGEVLHVIAETDGYYKVERKDGTVGWIGQWLVAKTDKSFSKDSVSKEPLFDVVGHAYETAIRYLANKKIVQGYADGSFLPNNTVNRAEFVKIIVGAVYGYDPNKDPSGYDIYSGVSFTDLTPKAWYIPYLCVAMEKNIISGYPDGTFRPASQINLAEASKILVNAFELTQSECKGCAWYVPYIKALQSQSYIPSTLKIFNQNVKRGEMAELIWRIMEKINNKPFSQLIN